MGKRITLEFTEREIEALNDILSAIEAMYGCAGDASDVLGDNETGNWDDDMKREIKHIDKMYKRNGYKRG